METREYRYCQKFKITPIDLVNWQQQDSRARLKLKKEGMGAISRILIQQQLQDYFSFYIFIICKLSMKLQVQYVGELDTNEEIKELFVQQPPENVQRLYESVTPILYQFRVLYPNGESMVYRSHDQIIRFLRKCMSKSKQLKEKYKTVTFDLIRKTQVIDLITAIHDIENQQWFQEFFSLGLGIRGRSISLTLKKQSGGRYAQFKCCFCLNWKKCKVYILNDGVVTYDESKNKIQQFMHFGKDFSWEVYPNIEENIIYIHSYHRKMTVKAYDWQDFFLFIYSLDKYLKEYKKNQMEYRFNSFAPMRYTNKVEFFIDGADYFEALAYGIESAQQEVFICGWWVSPEFNLIRPCEGKNKDYRLDNLLARTAEKGVKIYIVVYYQSTFLSNDSAYTIKALQDLHSNIKVLRHPQIVLPTYWSHHQKLVVIDQCLAFLGGLDICYGRYDDCSHLIHQTKEKQKFYPGIEYNNCRIADFAEVRNYTVENVGRHLPRLPWHDVALMVKGDCVKDLSRHFIEYWNYSSYQTHYAGRYVLISNSSKVIPKKKAGIIDSLKQFAQEVKAKVHKVQKDKDEKISHNFKQSNIESMSEEIQSQRIVPILPPKKSMSIKDAIIEKIMPQKRQEIGANSSPRELKSKKQSPSSELMCFNSDKRDDANHDGINIEDIEYQVRTENEDKCRKLSAQEILQSELENKERKKIEKKQKQLKDTFNQIEMIATKIEQNQHIEQGAQGDYLHEKQDEIQPPPKRNSLQIFTNFTSKLFSGKKRPESMKQNKKPAHNGQIQEGQDQNYTCQALRSASQWSIGSKDFQRSIYDSYISLIAKAEKFIYIQNQFFISATHRDGVVKNRIMEAISDRVIRAIQMEQSFKVVIMMPLVPGFAGELDDPSASLPRVIMNWQYKTICRGQNSLLGRIMKATNGADPRDYVQFYGLRNHGVINQQPFTEIIYLHSKLMIVDDRYLICGSANINDRSMEGNRDSQLCLLVEGEPKTQLMINKKPFAVVEKIHKLRTKLWWEHFGISEYEARNPNDEATWEKIYKIASVNTAIYRNLFGCYPDDEIKYISQISRFRKTKVDLKDYEENESRIKGHAVLFPLEFLEKEKLTSYHPHAISI